MTTTTAGRGRPPRRLVDPETGSPRVVWNGEPLDAKGNIVTDEPLDEEEDDEDEEEEEDEFDPETGEVVPPPPPAPPPPLPPPDLDALGDGPARPRKVRGRRPPAPPREQSPLAADIQAAREEVDHAVGKIDSPRDRVGCTLMRVRPALWKGKNIAGWLGRWNEPLSTEEIANEFGGGDFEWLVYGPDPRQPKRTTLLERRTVKIAGEPRIARDSDERPAEIELVREVVQRSQRDVELARKEAEKAREESAALVKRATAENGSAMRDVMDMVMKVVQPSQGAVQQVEQRLIAAEEKRQRDEEKKEAERLAREERAEARRVQEENAREQRHREAMDAQEKRHEATLRAMQMNHEKDMARIQMEAQRTESSGSKVTEMMLTLTQKMAAESEARNMQFLSMMQTNAQAVAAATKAAEETKTEFLLKILTEKKDDTIESLVKMKKVMDLFGGGDKETGVWRDVLEGVKEAAPGIVAALRSGGGSPAPAAAPTIAPGSVAAVDLPPRRGKKRRRALAAAQAQPAAPAAAAPVDVAPVVEVVPAPAAAPAGNFKPDFPPDGMSPEESIKLLVVDIEQALKADWGEDQVFTDIVQKFPEGILALLKMVPMETALTEVNKVVPADWSVSTPRGQRMVRKLLERLVG